MAQLRRFLEPRIAALRALAASAALIGGCASPKPPGSPLSWPEPQPFIGATEDWMFATYGRPIRYETNLIGDVWFYAHPQARPLGPEVPIEERPVVCSIPNFLVEPTHLVQFDYNQRVRAAQVRDGERWRTVPLPKP